MPYILTEAPLIACEDKGVYRSSTTISLKKEISSLAGTLCKFIVRARDWKTISDTERYVEVAVDEISGSVVQHGLVIAYFFESERTVSLPFTFYQSKRALSFQPSYEAGRVFITILGNFILNPQIEYTFRILVVNSRALKQRKKTNWCNFEQAIKVLNLIKQ
ncbi:hypothetical protein CNR22_08045 [Sphingobacteriaceae bacterium]|nr:hypothetical protein CNR22_08045 [Sphingobacteriaceae bacterium]